MLRVGVLRVGVLRVGVLRVGVLRVGVLRVGVLRVGVLRIGVLRVGVLCIACERVADQVLRMRGAKHFRELDVYQGGMDLVMRIFEITKYFPKVEQYTLSDQVRRSSRSICANLAEAWRKRRYVAAFVAKLNDVEAEAAETQVHLEIAFRHGYIDQPLFSELDDACDKIISQVVKMIDSAPAWILKTKSPKNR